LIKIKQFFLIRLKYTPLSLAIIGGHTKCVELLVMLNDQVDLMAVDSQGNSIYQLCAQFNNIESLRFCLTRKDPRFFDPLYIRNTTKENVIHTASREENLEVIADSFN
jgi:hypothetical protein